MSKEGTKREQPEKLRSVKQELSSIRKYIAKEIGGGEVIRSLRDTLHSLGLKKQPHFVSFRHRLLLSQRAKEQRAEQKEKWGSVTKKKQKPKGKKKHPNKEKGCNWDFDG